LPHVCEFLETVTSRWLEESLKKCDQEPPIPHKKNLVLLPQTTKLVLPYTPKHPHSHEQKLKYLDHLFLPLMNAFMVGNILKKLSMDFPMIDGVFVPNFRTITFSLTSLKLEGSTPNLFTSLNLRPFINDGEQMMSRLRCFKTN
jgi:hypothetical protein